MVVEDSAVRKIVLEASENIAGKVDVGKFDSGIVKVNNVEEGKKSIQGGIHILVKKSKPLPPCLILACFTCLV